MASIVYKGKQEASGGGSSGGSLKERILFGFAESTTSDVGVLRSIKSAGAVSTTSKTGVNSLLFTSQGGGMNLRFNEIIRQEPQISMGCWVRFTSFNYGGPFASWDSNSIASGQLIFYNASGGNPSLPSFGVARASEFFAITAPSGTWALNTWHYNLVEIDKIDGKIRMWIDNVLIGETILFNPSASNWTNWFLNAGSDSFALGGYANAVEGITDIQGYIDDFFLATRITTPAERNWLWNGGSGNSLLLL